VAHALLYPQPMRHASKLLAALVFTACVSDGASDGKDDVGLTSGKADGEEISDCAKREIPAYLNAGHDAAALVAAGIHERAAKNLTEHRDGADGQFGTDDDDLFDSVEEVDAVAYVGPQAFEQLVAATADRCAVTEDAFAEAREVNKIKIAFPGAAAAPASYDYPSAQGFNLGGTEFWQRWSGGKSPTFNFSDGGDAARFCMQASAIRWETIMKDPPAEVVRLNEETNWSGSFFNWNDDYSGPDAWGDASAPRLWAWRTSLMKWISQTGKDGSCYLPTRDMLLKAAESCLARAASAAGEIQGCEARP